MATLKHAINNTPIIRQLNAAGTAYQTLKLDDSDNWVMDANFKIEAATGRQLTLAATAWGANDYQRIQLQTEVANTTSQISTNPIG